MKIHFFGAAQTVTGSQYYLEINGKTLLLECGLFQGKRAESYNYNKNFQFNPRKLDAVILSHAHIDHCGNLPNLVKNDYTGPIYCTSATADLTDLLVRDSAHIQESDIEYLNKKNKRKGEPLVEPLYTIDDAVLVKDLLVHKNYNDEFEPIPGVTARLVDAGHILGSAAIVLDVSENDHKTRLWFSGDIGRPGLPLISDPVFPDHCDYLMMESTYGDKSHENLDDAFDEMRSVMLRTFERRGKVIIPAFAVGRTQEIVFALNQMMQSGDLPRVPVFVDSPLAVKTTDIFIDHKEIFDKETHDFIRQYRHPALNFEGLTYTRSVEESKELNNRQDPMVIISASGMAEAGRILHHLKNNIENPRNTVMIVSWQAPHTLGRRIADREPRVKIFGEEYQLRAEVSTIGGLSAHAGQDLLIKYAQQVRNSAKKIILIHGEPRSSDVLIEKFKEQNLPTTYYPERFESMELK